MESQHDTRASTFKSFDGAVSPINAPHLAGRRRYSSKFDPYASDSSDSPSPLMKFLCYANPEGTTASSPAFTTPVKVEEDVIVMDGIPVPKSNKGGGEVRMRLPLMSSNSVVVGRSNSTSSSSSGSGGKGSGTENSKFHKNKLCRFWENSGICQYGYECQFAHGKEELRHHRFSGNINPPEIFKLNNSSEGSNSSSHGSKFPPISQVKAKAATAEAEEEEALSLPSDSAPTEMASTSDWTPQSDGVEVTLPFGSMDENNNPSQEDVDAYIEKVLYGTNNSRKRLPVFLEICPD